MLDETRRARRQFWLWIGLLFVGSFAVFAACMLLTPRGSFIRDILGPTNTFVFVMGCRYLEWGRAEKRLKRYRELLATDRKAAWTLLIHEAGRMDGMKASQFSAEDLAWISPESVAPLSGEEAVAAARTMKGGVGWLNCARLTPVLFLVIDEWIRAFPNDPHYSIVRRYHGRTLLDMSRHHELDLKKVYAAQDQARETSSIS